MRERQAITKEMARRYVRAGKRERGLMLAMSAATIDRLLAAKRRRLRLKGMSHTKPGSLLKSQIPVRTFAEWDQARPGFVEIDLVGHEGGDARGEFAYSLCATDVASGWTEVRIVRRARPPLDLRGAARRAPLPALPAARHRLRQRRRVHQRPPRELVQRAARDVHAQPRLREERLLLRRAEELERHPPRDRLRALRYRRGAGPDRRDLRRPAPLRELLPALGKTARQAAHWRQGLQALR